MFVMTVAPQKLICPHGSSYPMKAVIIETVKIVIPVFHTFFGKRMSSIGLGLCGGILTLERMMLHLYECYVVSILSLHFGRCGLLRRMLVLY